MTVNYSVLYQELDSTQCEVRGSRCHVFSHNYFTLDNFMYHFLCNRGILCCKIRRQKVWHVVYKIVDDDRLQKCYWKLQVFGKLINVGFRLDVLVGESSHFVQK